MVKIEGEIAYYSYLGIAYGRVAVIGFKFLDKRIRYVLAKVSFDFRHCAPQRKLCSGRQRQESKQQEYRQALHA
jgi:hypothetical protein